MVGPDEPATALLDALRSDLLRGDLRHLEAHLAALERLGSRIAAGGMGADLAALRAQADRNRDIVGAAAAGVRAALRRLGEAGAPTAVYARDGRRVAIGGPSRGPGSRA